MCKWNPTGNEQQENRANNFIITGWKIPRYTESFKPINTEAQLIQGQEMWQLYKGTS